VGRPRGRKSRRGPENSAHRGSHGASLKHRAPDVGEKADLRFYQPPDGGLGRDRRSASAWRHAEARGSVRPPASRAPSDFFESAIGRRARAQNRVARTMAAVRHNLTDTLFQRMQAGSYLCKRPVNALQQGGHKIRRRMRHHVLALTGNNTGAFHGPGLRFFGARKNGQQRQGKRPIRRSPIMSARLRQAAGGENAE